MTSRTLVVGPLELDGRELTTHADETDHRCPDGGCRKQELALEPALVLALLMAHEGDVVPRHELRCAGGDAAIGTTIRELQRALPDGDGLRADIRSERDGYRLVVDALQHRSTVGHVSLHHAGTRCWIGDRAVSLPPRLLELLRLLMRAAPAGVSERTFRDELGVSARTIHTWARDLRRELAAATDRSVDVARAGDGYQLFVDDPSERVAYGSLELELNDAAPWCWVWGERVDLDAREVPVLETLARHRNAVVSRADLCRTGCETPIDESTLPVLMSELRMKLAEGSRGRLAVVATGDGYALRPAFLHLGPLTLSTRDGAVTISGRTVDLSSQQVELLTVLLTYATIEPLAVADLVDRGRADARAAARDLADLDRALNDRSRGTVRVAGTENGLVLLATLGNV